MINIIMKNENLLTTHYSLPTKKGFTLIELLVVVAIIGILAATILAALGSARKQGTDASIKSELNSARSEGEIYYNSNSFSYSGVCDFGGVKVIKDKNNAICGESSVDWGMSIQLQAESTLWCVDSSGYAGPTTNPPSDSNPSCTLPSQ